MAPRYDLNGRNGDGSSGGSGGGGGGGGVIGAVARFWTHSYAPDYLGFAVLLTAYLLIQLLVEPFHRMFALSDVRIAFPHAEVERVPVWLNFVYALFVPLGVLLFYNSVFAPSSPFSSRERKSGGSSHRHHNAILGLAISLVLASFLTDVVKNAVGRPRPDLLARCKPTAPAASTTSSTTATTTGGVLVSVPMLVTIDVCTETDHHVLHDGWRSFPSGHSSFSFAGLGYLALFLAGQLRVFRDRRDLARGLVCLLPLLGAAMIAISRCQDYRHDVYDVCAGTALGLAVAWFSYRRYWPRLSSRVCDEPYPAPGSAEGFFGGEGERDGWRRVRDEEEGGPILGGRSSSSAGYAHEMR